MGRRLAKRTILLVVPVLFGLMLVMLSSTVALSDDFDVRQHLSTTTRYGAGKALAANAELPTPPSGCEPIHLNLVARHGTRSPTKKRIDELDLLVSRIAKQLEDNPEDNAKRPAWLHGFRSPWEGRKVGGELIPKGEADMYQLGKRIRERFPELFKYDYHPDIYPITGTQVRRSAASAVALGMGLFTGTGNLGEGKQKAFAVITDTRKSDILLRFHESCLAYTESKKLRKPAIQVCQNEVYAEVGASVSARHALHLTTQDAASLWLLCKQEAVILDIVDRACGLFISSEVELLEWADDYQAYQLKGYGEALNYKMGAPLLQDVVTTMEQAISASEGVKFEGALQVAKLRVAHAETIIPFSCLLGLFLDKPDVDTLQSEEPLRPLPKPPSQRLWKGSLVAPFGANTQLVLYKCPKKSGLMGDNLISDQRSSEYLVQVLHNEKPVTMPACNGSDFCPFGEFKETVAGPHLEHTFENVCRVDEILPSPKESWVSRVLGIFRSYFGRPSRHSSEL